MKTFRFLIAVLTLTTGAACTDLTPTGPTLGAPSLDGTPGGDCKAGGYVGSDGKWLCN